MKRAMLVIAVIAVLVSACGVTKGNEAPGLHRLRMMVPNSPGGGYDLTARTAVVLLVATAPAALCPRCGTPSDRIHARYRRTVADVPSHGRAVALRLLVRKFALALGKQLGDDPRARRRISPPVFVELVHQRFRQQ